MTQQPLLLKPRTSGGGKVTQVGEQTWRLEVPAGAKGKYRLAQLDDYTGLRRSAFRWQPPFQLTLQARASSGQIPGTWGFGLWNDPFSASLGLGGADRRMPALPQSAWFFYASPPNYLSFRDDLPAQGFLAAVFRSASISPVWMALGASFLTGLLLPPVSRWMRGMVRKLVRQGAALVKAAPTDWHAYSLAWQIEQVQLEVDGETALEMDVSPHARLGLVLWIDNQYAAWTPSGELGLGSLPNPEPAWIELKNITTFA